MGLWKPLFGLRPVLRDDKPDFELRSDMISFYPLTGSFLLFYWMDVRGLYVRWVEADKPVWNLLE